MKIHAQTALQWAKLTGCGVQKQVRIQGGNHFLH